MEEMGDTVEMSRWFATLRGAIWGLCVGASTFGPGGDGGAKAPTGMGLGGRSF